MRRKVKVRHQSSSTSSIFGFWSSRAAFAPPTHGCLLAKQSHLFCQMRERERERERVTESERERERETDRRAAGASLPAVSITAPHLHSLSHSLSHSGWPTISQSTLWGFGSNSSTLCTRNPEIQFRNPKSRRVGACALPAGCGPAIDIRNPNLPTPIPNP